MSKITDPRASPRFSKSFSEVGFKSLRNHELRRVRFNKVWWYHVVKIPNCATRYHINIRLKNLQEPQLAHFIRLHSSQRHDQPQTFT